MAEIMDLTCNEVIAEEYIEPQGLSLCKQGTGTEAMPVTRYFTRSRTRTGSAGEDLEIGEKRLKRRRMGRKKLGSEPAHQQKMTANAAARVVYEDPIHSVLPAEVRLSILKQIEFSELLKLRTVSTRWRESIDSMSKVNVRIDGEVKEFNGKCGLPIKTCQLVTLQNPTHRHLFKSALPEKVSIVRGICHVNFEELVLQWSYLTKLELCWRTLVKNLLFGRSASECSVPLRKKELLPNLTTLSIELLTYDDLAGRSKTRLLSNLTSLTSYDYPSLTKCSTSFVGYRQLHAENRYLEVLLPFLSRHSSSLTTLDFTLKYATHAVYPPAQPRHILFCVPANLKTSRRTPQIATDSQLVTTQLRKLNQSPEHHHEWVNMLNDKRKLELAIMTRFLNWTIKHLDFFAPTIKEFSQFIRSMDLMNITMYDSGAHNTVTQLDATVFQQCPQLAHLRVYRAPIIFHEDEVEPSAEIINFPVLPKTLQEIVVDGLPVSSYEIQIALGELCDLRSFHYFQSQVPRRNLLWTNGVTWEILQQIIKHPKLSKVKVHVTNIGQVRTQYEEPLRDLCHKYGWNTAEIVTGYMNMYQITLSRSNEK
ncbi:hypothetical protein Ocin01_00698 [Orchesella cincta]|uniref:F-box domain-containing protein n=1 Tax=Orchesella cincta TaxID=48709 RepID=A0A1D2NL49_ORCCI|nr:hypothetical protein Ocin01_00698 [Orchesella cincta]